MTLTLLLYLDTLLFLFLFFLFGLCKHFSWKCVDIDGLTENYMNK